MVKFRVEATEEEVALIKKAARKQGVSVSQFIRELFARNHPSKRKMIQSAAPMLYNNREGKIRSGQRAP